MSRSPRRTFSTRPTSSAVHSNEYCVLRGPGRRRDDGTSVPRADGRVSASLSPALDFYSATGRRSEMPVRFGISRRPERRPFQFGFFPRHR